MLSPCRPKTGAGSDGSTALFELSEQDRDNLSLPDFSTETENNPVGAVAELAAGAVSSGGFDDGASPAALRSVERFFASVWAPLVVRWCKQIVGGFGCLTLFMLLFYASRLRKATTQVEKRSFLLPFTCCYDILKHERF